MFLTTIENMVNFAQWILYFTRNRIQKRFIVVQNQIIQIVRINGPQCARFLGISGTIFIFSKFRTPFLLSSSALGCARPRPASGWSLALSRSFSPSPRLSRSKSLVPSLCHALGPWSAPSLWYALYRSSASGRRGSAKPSPKPSATILLHFVPPLMYPSNLHFGNSFRTRLHRSWRRTNLHEWKMSRTSQQRWCVVSFCSISITNFPALPFVSIVAFVGDRMVFNYVVL